MRAFLFVVFFAICFGSFEILLSGCGASSSCGDASVVVEGEWSFFGSFPTKSSTGLAVISTPPESGLYTLFVSSADWAFPSVQMEVLEGKRVELNVRGELLQRRDENGPFLLFALGRATHFEERPAFSLWGLVSSPMVVMGGVTVGMMLMIQLLLKSMGTVDDIRKELRGKKDEELEEKTKKTKKAAPVSKKRD